MSAPDPGMQFDTAEPVQAQTSAVRCAACGTELGTYFEVNGAIACTRCKDAAVRSAGRSHVPTLLAAAGLGLVAAAVGSAIYYAVAKVTGYEIGLISIVVGLLVGFAVRKGSRARGGWRYQALAIFLTYLAIASTYVPRVFEAMEAEKAGAPAGAAAPAPGAAPGAAPSPAPAPAAAPSPSPAPAEQGGQDAGGGSVAVALLVLLGFTLALPFLAGLDNVMGLVLIAIALYEAWKVNRIPPLSVSGPFAVGAKANG